ncbi:MAG: phosphatase PAP2 family protein [Lachnospiraceae bacterium]|nr:phosphatase PAP2 family protein [Lachnospiraceae bacterium]
MWDMFMNIDANALLYIQDHFRSELGNYIIIKYTHLGDAGKIWLLLVALLFICPKTRKLSGYCLLSIFICFLTGNIVLKNVIARTRPYEVIEMLRCIIEPQKDFSFPSGHTSIAFAATVPILINGKNKILGSIAVIAALFMGLSRLYVGVHYPTDVLAGMILGIVSAVISCRLIRFVVSQNTHLTSKN